MTYGDHFGRRLANYISYGLIGIAAVAIVIFAATSGMNANAQEPPTRHCSTVKFDNAGNFHVCDMPDGARCVVDDRGTPSCYLPK